MKNLTPITTSRLLLNKPVKQDIPQIVQYAGTPNIAKTTLNIPHPYSESDAEYWINSAEQGLKNGTQYTFAVRINEDSKFIGGAGLIVNRKLERASLGYWIAEPYWNQGYASEATRALLNFGFYVLKLNKIYATHLPENPASGKVMIKNGMIKEGVLKEHTKKNTNFRSLVQYRLTKKEFLRLDQRSLKIRPIRQDDCLNISEAFSEQGWNKPAILYGQYVRDQTAKIRDVLIAEWDGEFAGYLTIKWQSDYLPFRAQKIPEIVDFNVLQKYQRKGIGNALMQEAELRIQKISPIAGLGVGLTADYGAAQALYAQRNYIPDGRGLVRNSESLKLGEDVKLGHDLVLCMTKTL